MIHIIKHQKRSKKNRLQTKNYIKKSFMTNDRRL